MPRGFLVKRSAKCSDYYSHRTRRNSVEDRSDSGSEYESCTTYLPSESVTCHRPIIDDATVEPKDYSVRSVRYVSSGPEVNRSPSLSSPVQFVEETDCKTRPLPIVGPVQSPARQSTASSAHVTPGVICHLSSPFHLTSFDRLSVSTPKGHRVTMKGHLVTAKCHQITGQAAPTNHPSPQSPKKRNAIKQHNQKDVRPKKPKAARKLNFDDDLTSPVSGTIIRATTPDDTVKVVSGDIDASLNVVEVTPEAMAELDKIENKLGDYVCRLCKEQYGDAFQLASHRCSRIVHIEYRCPDCEKVFNCPANLASHRRWHKPRATPSSSSPVSIRPANPTAKIAELESNRRANKETNDSPRHAEGLFVCVECGKKFRRQAYLRKHLASIHSLSGDDDRNKNNATPVWRAPSRERPPQTGSGKTSIAERTKVPDVFVLSKHFIACHKHTEQILSVPELSRRP